MKAARLLLAVAGVLISVGVAGAQGPGGPGTGNGFVKHRTPMAQAFGLAHGQFWNNPNLVKQLNLTDDQRKAMDGILQDHRMKLIDLQATLQKAEVAMTPLMKADTPNRSAIEAQIDKVVQARGELERANSRFLLDIRMQLTADQWKQLQTMRDNRMQRDGQDGRRGWGPGGPPSGMRRPDGQFGRPQGPPPAGTAPQGAPAPQPPGGGDE
jgi:periplasmic protein CpxP/Spy